MLWLSDCVYCYRFPFRSFTDFMFLAPIKNSIGLELKQARAWTGAPRIAARMVPPRLVVYSILPAINPETAGPDKIFTKSTWRSS